MSEKKPVQKKKMLITAILTILREHTDGQRHLRQAPIMKLLEEEHQLTATRKSVRKNLGDLQEAGYPVKFKKGWYYDPGFTPDELDFLRACIMGSDLRADKRMVLLDKLATLGGPFYQPDGVKGPFMPLTNEFPVVMNTLFDAIAKGRVVSFRISGEGEKKRHQASPYRLETRNARCVLVCHVDADEGLAEIPVESIEGVKILTARITPIEKFQQ